LRLETARRADFISLRGVSRPAVFAGASAKTCRFRQAAGTEEGAILDNSENMRTR